MAEIKLVLYSGPRCSLCEHALELIAPHLGSGFQLREVDITTSLELKKRYGLIIPVLRREDSGAELGWPFDQSMLEDFLRAPQS